MRLDPDLTARLALLELVTIRVYEIVTKSVGRLASSARMPLRQSGSLGRGGMRSRFQLGQRVTSWRQLKSRRTRTGLGFAA